MTITRGDYSCNTYYYLQIITKRVECKIIQYVLTLSYNQSQNKISGVQEIIAISDSNHTINDLYPGFEYGIKLTPKTTNGPLSSSPIYLFTPPIMGNIFFVILSNKTLISKIC